MMTTPTLTRPGRRAQPSTAPAITRAIIYARQSADAEDGIDRQVEDCRKIADQLGVTDIRVIPENDTSASKDKVRPGFVQALAELEAGGPTTVLIAQTQDRLLRKPREMEDLIDLVERTGAHVRLYRSMFDLSTAMGRAQARGGATWARLEVEQKAERQMRAEEQKVERGLPPRKRAFGYLPGGMEIDPAEGPAVADAYRRVLAGESLSSIARRWNDAGLRTAFGRDNRKEWTYGTVRKVLLNPRYAAIRTFYGEEVGPGVWPAIVDEETFRQTVAVLEDPARRTHRGTARKYLGGGLYRCGRCKSDMRTTSSEGVRQYRCRATKHLTRKAEPIDFLVVRAVEERLSRSDAADLVSSSSPELASLYDQSKAKRARLRRLEKDYGDGEISARVLREQSERINVELDVIKARTAELTRSSRLAEVVNAPDPVGAFRALEVAAQQEIVDALMVVTLTPVPPGLKRFEPETVQIEWRK